MPPKPNVLSAQLVRLAFHLLEVRNKLATPQLSMRKREVNSAFCAHQAFLVLTPHPSQRDALLENTQTTECTIAPHAMLDLLVMVSPLIPLLHALMDSTHQKEKKDALFAQEATSAQTQLLSLTQ